MRYGVATISRLLKIIRLFCRISSLSNGCFAKETHDFKEPTNRSHLTVCALMCCRVLQCVAVCCSVSQCVAVCCSEFSVL